MLTNRLGEAWLAKDTRGAPGEMATRFSCLQTDGDATAFPTAKVQQSTTAGNLMRPRAVRRTPKRIRISEGLKGSRT